MEGNWGTVASEPGAIRRMPVYVFRAGRPRGSGLPVSWDIRPHQWRVIQRASDRRAKLVEPAPLDALKRNTRLMIGGRLMKDRARLACRSYGPKRVPCVFAAMFAATIMPYGFASAQPDSYGAINGRVVPKSAAADLEHYPIIVHRSRMRRSSSCIRRARRFAAHRRPPPPAHRRCAPRCVAGST